MGEDQELRDVDSIQEQEKSRKHVLPLVSGKNTPHRHLANLDPHWTCDLQKQMLNVSDMLEYTHEGESQ